MPARARALRPPLVSAPDLPETLSPTAPARSAELFSAIIALTDSTDLAHSSIAQCRIEGTATDADLRGATLMDVELNEVRVADLQARDANLRRVRISGGRIGTLNLTDARIDELELVGVRIDYLTLAAAKAVDVRITDCQITALDLPGATLTRLAFTDSRSDEVDTRGLRAQDLDLRGLDALSFLDVASLRGTTLTFRQVELLAPAFAAAAGIALRD